jgi:predicted GIY-YIG superfamily endonuclease
MPIDQYEHSFQHLVDHDLKTYMSVLERDLATPKSMSAFSVIGSGVVTISRNFGLEVDFPGCYVLMDGRKPIYVGISKGVIQRLIQHARGKTHFDASLAYKIAATNMPHGHTRSKAMETEEFQVHFNKAQKYIRSLNVAFVKILNPLALYVFEPYCAMKLETSDWNTFETH